MCDVPRDGAAYPPAPHAPLSVKTAALYLALVVVPVLGVVGVLRVGGLLEAPPAVGGAWRVTEGALCAVPGRTFAVGQSGAFLHLRLPGRSDLPARLVGDHFEAEGGALSSVSPGCRSGAVRVEAQIGEDVSERIVGRMGIPGCGGCPMRAFAAVRDTLAAVPDAPAAQPAH